MNNNKIQFVVKSGAAVPESGSTTITVAYWFYAVTNSGSAMATAENLTSSSPAFVNSTCSKLASSFIGRSNTNGQGSFNLDAQLK